MTTEQTDPATAEDRERRLEQIRTNLDQSTIKGTIPTAYCSWSDEGVADAREGGSR